MGGSGNDYLSGDGGNDALYGDSGSDVIKGGDGRDFLWGGAGDDTLTGGADNDEMTGGLGADTFMIQAAGLGDDLIHGFADNVDTLVLSGFGFANVGAVIATGTQYAGGAYLSLAPGLTIDLPGMTLAQLANDIVII